MPWALTGACLVRPCPNRAVKYGRCKTHQAQYLAADVKRKEFYRTPRWKAIRAAQLAREPYCRRCALKGLVVKAVVADHIRPRRVGGPDTPYNLQSLCLKCHGAKGIART